MLHVIDNTELFVLNPMKNCSTISMLGVDLSYSVPGRANGEKVGYGFDLPIGGRPFLLGRPYGFCGDQFI